MPILICGPSMPEQLNWVQNSRKKHEILRCVVLSYGWKCDWLGERTWFYALGEPESDRSECFGIDFSTEYRFHTSFHKKDGFVLFFLTMDKSAGGLRFEIRAWIIWTHKLILSADHNLYKSLYASWKLSYIDRAGDYTDFKTGEKKSMHLFYGGCKVQWSKASYDLYLDLK